MSTYTHNSERGQSAVAVTKGYGFELALWVDSDTRPGQNLTGSSVLIVATGHRTPYAHAYNEPAHGVGLSALVQGF